MNYDYDLIVIGGGSGGIGAALSAARGGLSVLLIERAGTLGGTAVRAGVSCWEMGAGGTGIPFDIYRRLKRYPDAVGIYSIGRHCLWPGADEERAFPGGESVIDPDQEYMDTLRRWGAKSMAEDEAFVRQNWHGVVFEPSVYAQVVEEMLEESGRCEIHKNARVVDVKTDGLRLRSVVTEGGDVFSAPVFIDSTGGAFVASLADCRRLTGRESREAFGEPGAAEEPSDHLNAATLMYRVTPTDDEDGDDREDIKPVECWWRDDFPVAAVNEFPCDDLSVNMLPTMEGRKVLEWGKTEAYAECRRRVRVHWAHLQQICSEFRQYRLSWIAPEIGVRETYRVVARYMLTQHDLMAGLSEQDHHDIITIADHSMDTHGSTSGRAASGELDEPYGVPYRCLLPRSLDNLLVACRGSGFSSVAASSCRLSRTIMQLGQAAGNAAVIAAAEHCDLSDVPVDQLRSRLRHQHVQLEWPLREEVAEFIRREEENSGRG